MSLHCLLERLLKYFSRRQKQSNFVVIGALRENFMRLSSIMTNIWGLKQHM